MMNRFFLMYGLLISSVFLMYFFTLADEIHYNSSAKIVFADEKILTSSAIDVLADEKSLNSSAIDVFYFFYYTL